MFSFDPNPEALAWQRGGPTDLALQRRLNEAADPLATMSAAQGYTALANLNKQPIILATDEALPAAVMQQRLDQYARLWSQYAESTHFVV